MNWNNPYMNPMQLQQQQLEAYIQQQAALLANQYLQQNIPLIVEQANKQFEAKFQSREEEWKAWAEKALEQKDAEVKTQRNHLNISRRVNEFEKATGMELDKGTAWMMQQRSKELMQNNGMSELEAREYAFKEVYGIATKAIEAGKDPAEELFTALNEAKYGELTWDEQMSRVWKMEGEESHGRDAPADFFEAANAWAEKQKDTRKPMERHTDNLLNELTGTPDAPASEPSDDE